jgi:hypothetical protein
MFVTITVTDTSKDNILTPVSVHGAQYSTWRYIVNKSNTFHYVEGIHIRSAYLDVRIPGELPFVRMMGVLKCGGTPELYCHFPYITDKPNGTTSILFATPVTLFYEMCEQYKKTYAGWIISCKVPIYLTDSHRQPCEVIVSINAMIDINSANGAQLS